MLCYRKPSAISIQNFLQEQGRLKFSYADLTVANGIPPAGYVIDHTRLQLGTGEAMYEAAKAAITRWDQLRVGWVEAVPADTPIRTGEMVGILARVAGLWWLNACRIVSVVNESGEVSRYGFKYGTLPDHVGMGEEQFLVEWNSKDDSVWYEILAISRPNQFLARLGYPIVRRTQRRFGRDSSQAMLAAVQRAGNRLP